MTVVLALPLAITMRGLLQAHLGASLAAEGAANGVNYDWWQEFTSQATGIGTTFSPTIIGFAATLDNISSLLDGQRESRPHRRGPRAVSARLDFPRRRHHRSLCAATANPRSRLLRRIGRPLSSGCSAWPSCRGWCYWWLFAYVHPWLFLEWFADRTRTMAVERDVFLWRVVALRPVRGSARGGQRDLRLREDPRRG